MSFFSKLFSGGGETSAKEKKQIPWNNLTQVEQLDAIILESKELLETIAEIVEARFTI